VNSTRAAVLGSSTNRSSAIASRRWIIVRDQLRPGLNKRQTNACRKTKHFIGSRQRPSRRRSRAARDVARLFDVGSRRFCFSRIRFQSNPVTSRSPVQKSKTRHYFSVDRLIRDSSFSKAESYRFAPTLFSGRTTAFLVLFSAPAEAWLISPYFGYR
jgi:hypothetical protein